MSRFTPFLFAILAGAVAYGVIRGLQRPDAAVGSISHVVPSMTIGATNGAKSGATHGANMVTPTMAPSLAPVITMTPILTPSLTPTPKSTPTPIPYTKITPNPTPTPVITPTPTPSASSDPSPNPTPTATPETRPIVINEIGWMGTEAQSSDEWLELYNPNDFPVDLSGWKILIAGDNAISLSGSIDPGGYYLLERTDDSAIGDVGADYTGPFGRYGFSDSGEHLTLVDSFGSTIDDVDCSSGWFAGIKDKGSKASMERVDVAVSGDDPTNWATNGGSLTLGHDANGAPIRGTPRAKNSVQ